ncbi:MAG: hypothetical protein R3F61_06135 [Myxococcota bacterium]
MRAVLLMLAACGGETYVDDPVAFIGDAGYRRRVLEADLVSVDNQYAQQRLENVGRAWDALPLRDPPSVPVTAEHAAAARAGEPLPFDPDRATTLTPASLPTSDAEWIALGERVFFEYPLRGDLLAAELLALDDGPESVGYLVEDGAYVGMRAFELNGVVRIGPTCAQCHVGRGPDGALTGQRSNRAMDVGLARYVALDPQEQGSETENTALQDLLRLGPGRADVLADPVFNPYAFPDFGGLADVPYLHHNANWTNRGVATLALRSETLFITSNYERSQIPRELAWAVAMWIRSLPPLDPPEPDHPLKARGAEVFDAAGCSGCHVPPLYTSDRRVTLDEVGTDAAAGASDVRGTGLYRIPSLRGVAHLAPYLHHGAFATLEAMFDPAREEPGHPWGLELDSADREALLGFLRSI